jgi:hypothetical protein
MSGRFLTCDQLRLQLPAHLAFVGPGQERASLALPASRQKAALDRWHAPELGLHVAYPTAQPHGIGADGKVAQHLRESVRVKLACQYLGCRDCGIGGQPIKPLLPQLRFHR